MQNVQLNNALIQAADCDLDSVLDLLAAGANPNGMPLIMAIQCGAEDVVTQFIKHGVDVNAKYDGTTPLIRAVTSGYPKIVELLVLNGALTTLKDIGGKTASDHLAECTMPRLTKESKMFIAGLISE